MAESGRRPAPRAGRLPLGSSTRALGLLLALAACGDEAEPPAPSESPDRPNVLFIVWDTVRADRLSAFGYEHDTTPKLARFAAECAVFETAVSPGIWTLPSHASMFTGIPASAHGVNADHKWLDDRFATLAESFQEEGYSTYAFSANPFVSARTNLLQGFDRTEHPYDERWREATMEAIERKQMPGDRSQGAAPGQGELSESQNRSSFKECGPVLNQAFLQWLEDRDGEAPFFAFLNYMEAHIPRIPSREAREVVMDEATLDRSLVLDQRHILLLAHMAGKQQFSEDDRRVISAVYDAALVDLDRATGDLLDTLRANGVLDDTIVVITSDHGENLGDHGFYGHKFCIWDTLLRVPLMIRFPDRVRPERIPEPVSTMDLFATLHELAGLPASGPRALATRSLFDPEHPRHLPGPVFAEMLTPTPRALRRVIDEFGELDLAPFSTTYQAVVQNGYKLIRPRPGDPELYHVAVDREESRDLAGERAEMVESLAQQLDAWLASFPAYDPSASDDSERGRLSDELRRMIEQLGYAADGDEDDEDREPVDSARDGAEDGGR